MSPETAVLDRIATAPAAPGVPRYGITGPRGLWEAMAAATAVDEPSPAEMRALAFTARLGSGARPTRRPAPSVEVIDLAAEEAALGYLARLAR